MICKIVDFIVTIYANGGCRTFIRFEALTFLNRSGNPATGSRHHLEKIQCIFSSDFFIYGNLAANKSQN